MVIYDNLYKLDSLKNTRIWYAEQSGDSYRIISGIKDGNLVTSEWKKAEPTNEGRSNHRDAEQQAKFEVEALYKKKKKLGYVDDLKNINKSKFQCMLAKKFADYKDKVNFYDGSWVCQTKYNGCRCILTKDGAFSRTGEKFLTVSHIEESFKEFFEQHPNAVIDGELFNYDYRESLNELIKLVRKTKNFTSSDLERSEEIVKYYIYDGYLHEDVSDTPYKNRSEVLYKEISKLNKSETYVFTEDYVFENEEDLNEYYLDIVSDGQEGVILRRTSAPYEHKRSKYLLKHKPVDDDECIIVDIHEGSGNWSGRAKTATISWNEKTFDATFKGSQDELARLLNEKDSHIGKEVKFHYFGLTGLGTPNFAQIDLKNCSPEK